MADNVSALVKCGSYDKNEVGAALDAALSLCNGLDWVKPGMKIMLKPNMLTSTLPEAGVTTHPSIVCALTERLKALGAEVLIAESPGGLYTPSILKNAYKRCGIIEAEAAGAILNYDVSSKDVFFESARVLKHIDVITPVLECDAVISLSKLKTHSFMLYTGAVKNLFGVIPGVTKAEYHYRFDSKAAFADMLIDLCEFVRPALSIMDAVVTMEGEGPSGGKLRDTGALIVSKNPYFADVIGASIMGLEEGRVYTQAAARRRGLLEGYQPPLGESIETFAGRPFELPRSTSDMDLAKSRRMPGVVSKLLKGALESRPELSPDECIGCGLCRDNCPAKCIELADKKPVINRSKCLKCYCCQELCPKHAMKVKRAFIARAIQRTQDAAMYMTTIMKGHAPSSHKTK